MAVALSVAFIGHAQAAPGNGPNALVVDVDCGSGPFGAVINIKSNGTWTPAHIVGGGTFTPQAFGESTSTFTDASGNTTSETDPGISKKHLHGDLVTCTCSFSAPGDEPGSTFSVTGTVTGVIHGDADLGGAAD